MKNDDSQDEKQKLASWQPAGDCVHYPFTT